MQLRENFKEKERPTKAKKRQKVDTGKEWESHVRHKPGISTLLHILPLQLMGKEIHAKNDPRVTDYIQWLTCITGDMRKAGLLGECPGGSWHGPCKTRKY